MSEMPETIVSDKGGEFTPQIFSVDDIDTDEVVTPEVETEKQTDEPEIEVEGKKDVTVEDSETKRLAKEVQELKSELLKVLSLIHI